MLQSGVRSRTEKELAYFSDGEAQVAVKRIGLWERVVGGERGVPTQVVVVQGCCTFRILAAQGWMFVESNRNAL